MKEAFVSPDGAVQIKDSPAPKPGPSQVLIKVEVSGSNPKDWKYPIWTKQTLNAGDDIAGTVVSVGAKVFEFKPGDRVFAFHEMHTPGGSYAEYAIAWDYTTAHIPEPVSYEEAATFPLAYLTSAIGLYQELKLVEPWSSQRPKDDAKPVLLVYGASSATGAFAAQLGKLSNYTVIGIAGNAAELAKSVSDYYVDYRQGEDALVASVESILQKLGVPSKKVKFVYDAISENGSHEAIARLVDAEGGRVTHLLPPATFSRAGQSFEYPDGVAWTLTSVGRSHKDFKDFAYVALRYLARLLQEGRFTAQPHQLVPGGLDGVQTALKDLKDGKASGVKYVFRVPETTGAAKSQL